MPGYAARHFYYANNLGWYVMVVKPGQLRVLRHW
mgnify:CR=1 FL=1